MEEGSYVEKQFKIKCGKFLSALNLNIFQNKLYLAVCLNNVLVTFGLSILYVHLGSYGLSLGFTDNEATLLFSAIGAFNVLGRITFGLLGQISCLSSMSLYTGGFFFSGVVVALIPSFHSFIALLVCAGSFGAMTGCFGTHLAQVKFYPYLLTVASI